MRALAIFTKSLRELSRDWWIVLLTVTTAPSFVLLYWMITGGGSTTYDVLVLSHDTPATMTDGTGFDATAESMEAIRAVTYPDGQPMLDVTRAHSREDAIGKLESRDATALLVLPDDFSSSMISGTEPPAVTMVGDLTNPYYIVAAVMTTSAVSAVVKEVTGREPLLEFTEEPLGGSMERTEFEHYVPGLLLIAIMMMIFSAAMSIAREVESGTLERLRITRMNAFDYLAGTSATQILLGMAALVCTLAVAWALGFRAQGPIWAAFLIGLLTALPVVGLGLVVACFSRTVVRAFLVANLPFMLLMFFSGAVYPMAKIPLFEVGSVTVGLFDFLPTTHAVNALNRILTLGAGPTDVGYEIIMLIALSVIYFAAGVALFHRFHLRPRGG